VRNCQGCGKLTPPETLTFSDGGAELCRGCYGTLQSKQATRQARGADEYRKCPACANVMSPTHDERSDPQEQVLEISLSRRYDCVCGYGCRILAWPALVGLGIVGSMTALSAGRSFHLGDLDDAAIAGAVMIAVLGFLLHNIWLRRRCPRAL
jgi:hypothetical protein